MDYQFLKSKPVSARAANMVQRASETYPPTSYCVNDEQAVLKESRENPEQVYLLLSAGHRNVDESVYSVMTTITVDERYSRMAVFAAFKDIACELDDSAETLLFLDQDETLPEPISTFTVNEAVEVSIYPDAETGGVFLRLDADEIITNARDLLDAKARVGRVMTARGLSGINEDKSWINLAELKIPYHVDVPSDDVLLEIQSQETTLNALDAYAKLGLCHLYKNGACIAKVNFTGPQFIAQNVKLTHPHNDSLRFYDVYSAAAHTFGISQKISQREAFLYGIGNVDTLASEAVGNTIDIEVQTWQFPRLLHDIADRHGLSVDDAKTAFWDLYGGQVYGRDLLQYDAMKSLYHDIAKRTGDIIPSAKPVASLILQRLEDFDAGISPEERLELPCIQKPSKYMDHQPQVPAVGQKAPSFRA